MMVNNSEQILFTEKTNQKNTKNVRYEKGEFMEFAKNEQKKEIKKKFQEVLKEYPEIYQLINENERLKKENIDLVEDSIVLGEKYEKLKQDFELKRIEDRRDNRDAIKLKQEYHSLKINFEEIKEIAKVNKDLCENLAIENANLKNEITELKKNRSAWGKIKDKATIGFYINENKELKQKLSKVGRLSISNEQIRQIIKLYEEDNLGYERISKKIGVSKSTVCKYVKRYLAGKLELD